MGGRDDAIHTGVSDRDGGKPMSTEPTTPEVGITYLCDLRGAGKKRNLLFLPYADGDHRPWFHLDGGGVFYRDTDVTPIRPVTQRIPDHGGHPNPGERWLCNIGGKSGSLRGCHELILEDSGDRWRDGPAGACTSIPAYDVTPIRRLSDEGGHWERCTFEEYAGMNNVRRTILAGVATYEQWIPDTPPVTVPTTPNTYGIASGKTNGGVAFTTALCWIDEDSDIFVHLPGGRAGYINRHYKDRITAWRTIPTPGTES